MLKLNYEVVESICQNNHDLLYSDTDSFVYNIRCDDVYKWVRDNKTHSDNSDGKLNPDNTNMKIIGAFKDELSARPMTHFQV